MTKAALASIASTVECITAITFFGKFGENTLNTLFQLCFFWIKLTGCFGATRFRSDEKAESFPSITTDTQQTHW